jgi:hypothetical protein
MRSIGAAIWKYLNREPVIFSLRRNLIMVDQYGPAYDLRIYLRPGWSKPLATYLYADRDRPELIESLERAGYELRPKIT